MLDRIKTQWKKVTDWFEKQDLAATGTKILGTFVDGFRDLKQAFLAADIDSYGAGESIGEAIGEGIASLFSSSKEGVLGKVFAEFVEFVGGLLGGMFTGIGGTAAVNQFIADTKANIKLIKTRFEEEWALITEFFGASSLFQSGKDWIDGLWAGVVETWREMTAWIDDAIQSVVGALPEWVAKRLGVGDEGAQIPVPPGAPVPPALGAAQARVGGEVRIRVEGPPGTRVESVRSDNPDVPLDVTAGAVMLPGV